MGDSQAASVLLGMCASKEGTGHPKLGGRTLADTAMLRLTWGHVKTAC